MGTYYPTSDSDRTISFQIKDGMEVYGGFLGTETLISQRDWETNITILSGDIGILEDSSDNSYAVIFGSNTADTTAILDGFTITKGNSNSGAGAYGDGGGFYSYKGYMTIQNCYFINNRANDEGGAIHNSAGYLRIINCTFNNNVAKYGTQGWGGAICNVNSNSSAYIYNCTFLNNYAEDRAGAIYNSRSTKIINCNFINNYCNDDGGAIYNYSAFSSSPKFVNCIFSGNSCKYKGGAIYNYSHSDITNCTFYSNSSSSATSSGGAIYIDGGTQNITNCIFWENEVSQIFKYSGTLNVENCIVQGGYSGTNVYDIDPLFIDSDGADNIPGTIDDDLHLQNSSPAIDSGKIDTTGLYLYFPDLDGNSRIQGYSVDIGPYEIEQGTYVNFIPSQTNGCDSLTVTFSDLTTTNDTIVSWSWDFGNGDLSTLQNPSITYNLPGMYVVSLTVTDNNGSYSRVDSNLIDIQGTPTASFTLSDSLGCLPLSISMTDNSIQNYSTIDYWEYVMGDGAIIYSPDSTNIYTMSGVYNVLYIVGSLDCYDTVSRSIQVFKTFDTTSTIGICQGDSVFLSGAYQNTPGVYYDSLFTKEGCDSIVFTTLTIDSAYNINESASICTGITYIFPDSATSTISKVHTSFLTSTTGCDSIVITTLTVNNVDTSISISGTTLTASAVVSSYQWLDCGNSYDVINGDTTQNFTPFSNGSYAVEVTDNGCTDTSACITISTLGIDQNSLFNSVAIYYNPNSEMFVVEVEFEAKTEFLIQLINITGQIIYSESINASSSKRDINLSRYAKGVYALKVVSDGGVVTRKVVYR